MRSHIFGARHARALVAASLVTLIFAGLCAAPAGAQSRQQWLTLAEQGIAQVRSAFADNTHGLWNGKVNVPIAWYDEKLHGGGQYPLATIWGVVPLWESMSAAAVADPSPANKAALETFSVGPTPVPGAKPSHRAKKHHHAKKRRKRHPARKASSPSQPPQGAQGYFDSSVGGFAPYPGDRGKPNVWCDDNAWWGLAFMDAYDATGNPQLLALAQKALDFLNSQCWDASSGGFWWNTDHTPAGQKAGEPLAAGSLLGARLAAAKAPAASTDTQLVEKWLSWGDAHFAAPNGLYWRTQNDPTPTPYITGPTVEAKELLCKLNPGSSYCQQAKALADAANQRFADRLNMGPQFDVIYLHWMMAYGQQAGDPRWVALATEMANKAVANSKDPSTGLYGLNTDWNGQPVTADQAESGMLRETAAMYELFSWLAIYSS